LSDKLLRHLSKEVYLSGFANAVAAISHSGNAQIRDIKWLAIGTRLEMAKVELAMGVRENLRVGQYLSIKVSSPTAKLLRWIPAYE
jgi:hypothetical protein